MSPFGPKRTWGIALHMSAFGGKADIMLTPKMFGYDRGEHRSSFYCHGAKARICLGLSIVVNRRGDMQRRGERGQPTKGQRKIGPKARKAPTAQLSADHSPE